MKTKINDAITQRLQAASENAIYKEEMVDVVHKFRREFPTVVGLNVLTQRAILAKDITVVHCSKTKTFELWLTSEVTEDVMEQVKAEKLPKTRSRKAAAPKITASAADKALAKSEASIRLEDKKLRATIRQS